MCVWRRREMRLKLVHGSVTVGPMGGPRPPSVTVSAAQRSKLPTFGATSDYFQGLIRTCTKPYT